MKAGQTKKLTPMQAFAVELFKKEKSEINAGRLGYEWAEFKNARIGCASRDRFGNTSAAYRTLRSLEALGIIEHVQYSTYKLAATNESEGD